MQLLLRTEYVIFLLLLVHLLYVDLHVLIRLNCLASVELAFKLGRYLVFRGIENLVVELDLVLQTVLASIKKFDALLFVTIDGDFRFLGLERPALLIVVKRFVHLLLARKLCALGSHGQVIV